jgi:hypothetical protein
MRPALVADKFALAIIFDYKFSLLEIPLHPREGVSRRGAE